MSTDLEGIEAEALKLPIEDRERLVDVLLASLGSDFNPAEGGPAFASPEIEKAWIEECHRRMKLIESGEMETYSAEEVIAELRARLRR
jgi:hypothetical protein